MAANRILVAQNPKGLKFTQDALVGYELLVAADIQQAEYRVMNNGIDLFLLGIHFDESRAVELVSFIRKDEEHKDTPIIVVRFLPTLLADSLHFPAEQFRQKVRG